MGSTVKLATLPVAHGIKSFRVQQIEDVSDINDASTSRVLFPRLFLAPCG